MAAMAAEKVEMTILKNDLRLRQKFEPHPEHPGFIVTARGQGYRFNG